ncbi:MAG: AMP-binding protein [Erythrobacter sp.]
MACEIDITSGKDAHFMLRSHAEKRPQAPYLHWAPFVGDAVTYSYREFFDRMAALAAGLQARGVAKGDFVLLHAQNCPEFLLTWHACAAIGAVVVTTNPRSSRDEMRYFIEHSKVKFAVVQAAYLDLIGETGAQFEWLAVIAADGIEAPAVLPDGTLAFENLIGDAADFEHIPSDPMAPLSVQYTSGTTSLPKGVVWTHANALWAGQVGSMHKSLRDDDTALITTPLCHTNAMSWAHLPSLWAGGAIALQPKFSASRFWDVALRHRCTWGTVIPFAVKALAPQPVPPDHAMRFWIVGAANIGPLDEHFSVEIVGAWGMTETVIHATYTPPQLPSPPLSMGMPMPEYGFRLERDDGSAPVEGEAGLLKIKGERGVSLFLEYLHNPDATAESFDAGGWFDTGDRVIQSTQGHFRFADRAKDMLKVGAENVAASEVEAAIATVPDVIESAVVAKPDPMKDEVPVAFVRTEKPSDELRETIFATCREKLADFKVPVAIVFCEDFPRAEVNKVAKGKLRDEAAALEL